MEELDRQNRAFEKRLKRQVIGKPHRFLAVVPLGFEQTFVDELGFIGQEGVEARDANSLDVKIAGDGKVEFTAKLVEAWKIAAYSRIANRIMMHIADFKAENFRELEKKANEIPWELFLDNKGPARVDIHVTCKHSRLYHSDAVAERLDKILPAPSTPQSLFVSLVDDRCTLWLDLAGEELYKRGHERFVNDAPLKETIAAGMILEAISTLHIIHHQSSIINYPLSITLIDPMAGSGTFSLEAAYQANDLIPGLCRDFALKHQPAFKEATWKFITSQAPPASRLFQLVNIVTSDISEKAVEIIRHNVECSPLATVAPSGPAPVLDPQIRDFFSYTAAEIADAAPGPSQPIILLNPPYGKRLDFDAPRLYTHIGRRLAELARDLAPFNKALTVAILAPKDDTRPGSRYTCTANLLRECPALDPDKNTEAKSIATSHGGFALNAIIARI
ncbi:THUMP domain-containing class I SAM-dependent RNA methyltransferase [Fibrobacter sp. UBA3629]|uniref:THUMP domain-containing class I SAM-dependent RNA methyltransferase n=1 Tax=Fibrobacter sp. UBA3629 TaxID=1946530 RepID=UPI0025BBA5BD|nr:RNA methyltransferase [Fibrobacter sp. UBA3629]